MAVESFTFTAGSTSRIVHVMAYDSSVTTDAGLAALVFNAASLTAYYIRNGDTGATAITLATATIGTWASGGFKLVHDTNTTGLMELGIPNACLAAGATECTIVIKGATNLKPIIIKCHLIVFDQQSVAPNVNVAQISTDSGAADNLETMLDGTGGQVLTLDQLRIDHTSSNGGIYITSNSSHGINVISTASGFSGVKATGSGAGDGLTLVGGNSAGHGLRTTGGTGGNGLYSVGTTTGNGAQFVKGASGVAFVSLTNTLTTITGSITGNLSGSVGSVTATVNADMVKISTDATAADNLETMLDGTGGQTLSLGNMVVTSATGNAIAIQAPDGFSGISVQATGVSGAPGITVTSQSGNGIYVAASSGYGWFGTIHGDIAGNIVGNLTGNLVLGTITTSGTATFNAVTVTTNLLVSGNSTVTGTTTLTGAVSFGSTFGITGGATLTGAVIAANASNNIVGIDVAKLSGDATAADNAESFFDGTGYAGTNNVIPLVTAVTTVNGLAANTITAASIASAALTAAKFAADAIDSNALANSAATEIATQVDTTLTSTHGAGSWNGSTSTGSGAYVVTVTVTDDFSAVVPSANVRLTQGVNDFVAQTNASGVATFALNAATYTRSFTKDGYVGMPDTITVTAAANFNLSVTRNVAPAAPSDPSMCRISGYLKSQRTGAFLANTTVTARREPGGQAYAGGFLIGRTRTAVSATSGLFQLDVEKNTAITPSGSTWTIICEEAGINYEHSFTTATFDLSTIVPA